MSLATLDVRPVPEVKGARTVTLDCPHGTTTAHYVNAPEGQQLADADVVRTALLRYHEAQRCRCIRLIWRRYYGCRWPEIPLVRAQEAHRGT